MENTKTITVNVWASTRYVGSTVKDVIEVEVDADTSEEEINKEIESAFNDWLQNNVEAGWSIKS